MPHKKKKPMDYRAFANKHFRDPTHHLPMISGTGHNTPKYVSPNIKKAKKLRKYKTVHECYCGNTEERESILRNTLMFLNKKSFVACSRCTNLMKLKRIEENIFVIIYLYANCLLQSLKRK